MAKINKIKVGSTTYDAGGASGGYGTATLSTSSWAGTAPSLYQTVSITGITANDNAVCDVLISDAASIDSCNEGWSKIWKAETLAGQVKFYASETPSVALTVSVKW